MSESNLSLLEVVRSIVHIMTTGLKQEDFIFAAEHNNRPMLEEKGRGMLQTEIFVIVRSAHAPSGRHPKEFILRMAGYSGVKRQSKVATLSVGETGIPA